MFEEADLVDQDKSGQVYNSVFDHVVQSQPDAVTETELLGLLYLKDHAGSVELAKVQVLAQLNNSIISSNKFSTKKRMLALYVSSAFAPYLGPEKVADVLKVLSEFVEGLEEDEKVKVYRCMKTLSDRIGGKHSLLKSLLSMLKKVFESTVNDLS